MHVPGSSSVQVLMVFSRSGAPCLLKPRSGLSFRWCFCPGPRAFTGLFRLVSQAVSPGIYGPVASIINSSGGSGVYVISKICVQSGGDQLIRATAAGFVFGRDIVGGS